MYIYRSYYKNKLGGPFFGPPCTLKIYSYYLTGTIILLPETSPNAEWFLKFLHHGVSSKYVLKSSSKDPPHLKHVAKVPHISQGRDLVKYVEPFWFTMISGQVYCAIQYIAFFKPRFVTSAWCHSYSIHSKWKFKNVIFP